MEEFKLIRQAVDGDMAAFEKLIIPYEKKVYNVALGICKNEQDAYDISQEVFIKVYKKLSSFEFNSRFSTWLYRIVKNTALDYLRKEGRFRDRQIGDENLLVFPDDAPEPIEEIIEKENVDFVRYYLDRLGEPDRSMLIFREMDGLSYEELSKVFDMKMGTVKSRIFRAKKKLKELILKDVKQKD